MRFVFHPVKKMKKPSVTSNEYWGQNEDPSTDLLEY